MLKNYTELCDSLRKSENYAEANLKFALSRAHKYKQYGNFDDIVSAANYGLVKAAEKYDPNKKVKFISYAVHWIDKYIKEYLSERSVRIPNSQNAKLTNINKMIDAFKVKHKREPSIKEICKAMKMKPLSVAKTINGKVQSVVSLNEVLDEDVGGTFEQMLPDQRATPDDSCDQKFRLAAIHMAIKSLTKNEASVIKLYFFEDLNFTEIAEKLEIDYKEVRSNFKSAMDTLKVKFQDFDLQ